MARFIVETVNQTDLAARCDAEYYASPYRDYLDTAFATWKDWVLLRDASTKLTSGHTPLRHDLTEGDCQFLTVECVSPLTIRYDLSKRVWRQSILGELARVNLVAGDVLITIKRRIVDSCAVSASDLDVPVAVNQDVAVMRPKSDFVSDFVSTFLVSKLGKYQAMRAQTEQMNPYISVGSLGQLLLPIVPRHQQEEVASIVEQRRQLLQQSQSLYAEAESLLHDALGLDTLNLSHELTYEGSFRDMERVGRWDSDYYQPKYQQAMSLMAASGQTLQDVAHLAKRPFQGRPDPTHADINGTAFRYIEIGGVGGEGLAESEIVPYDETPDRAQWIVRAGDVITSTVRPIRRLSALIEPQQGGCVCSSGFAVLQPYAVEPEVLLVYLRLPIVCEVLDLHCTATMYPAISTSNLMEIPITLPDTDTRGAIVEKVRTARQSLRDAERLLEKAKRRVEEMILGKE